MGKREGVEYREEGRGRGGGRGKGVEDGEVTDELT